MISALIFGFLMGMKHALDADHVVAVVSLVGREFSAKSAFYLGASWGLGHLVTLFGVVLLALQLGEDIPEGFSQTLEVIVGVMLILMGVGVMIRLIRNQFHCHFHNHGGTVHVHLHEHWGDDLHASSTHQHKHRISRSALAIGLVHGLAGSAALLVMTVATTDLFWMGMAYTALFGLGSILGMAFLSAAIALPVGFFGSRLKWIYSSAFWIVGLASIAIGMNLFVGNYYGTEIFW